MKSERQPKADSLAVPTCKGATAQRSILKRNQQIAYLMRTMQLIPMCWLLLTSIAESWIRCSRQQPVDAHHTGHEGLPPSAEVMQLQTEAQGGQNATVASKGSGICMAPPRGRRRRRRPWQKPPLRVSAERLRCHLLTTCRDKLSWLALQRWR